MDKKKLFYKDYKRELEDLGADDGGKKIIPIAVDFDGTIVKHKFPEIGEEVPFAIDVINVLMEDYNVGWILNTMRTGKLLREAVNWCKEHGIHLYGINRNPTQDEWESSSKTYAQFYVDDSNVCQPLVFEKGYRPYVDWMSVYNYLVPILEYMTK